jgi:ethanolamine utilization protein EutJ
MKYITESELRDLFKNKPFTTYYLDAGARITPGAREFLTDRKIEMVQLVASNKEKSRGSSWRGNMSEEKLTFAYCDQLVRDFEKVIEQPIVGTSSVYYTGVDLGTACVVLAVLDENNQPVAGAYRYADVVRDGMVVDYIGAVNIVRDMKKELEEKLGTELLYAAAAIPPGTDELDSGAVKNVVQAAGFELTNVLDEPTAANEVLKMVNGAVVDIGGGTTGISILKDGKVVYVEDEPTGGTHFSLVISGAYKIPFAEAETYKRNEENHRELLPVLKPVVEKISSIITRHVQGYDVKEISLVGGTCCLGGIEEIIETKTGIFTHKPQNPMFVTPLGIALSCRKHCMDR